MSKNLFRASTPKPIFIRFEEYNETTGQWDASYGGWSMLEGLETDVRTPQEGNNDDLSEIQEIKVVGYGTYTLTMPNSVETATINTTDELWQIQEKVRNAGWDAVTVAAAVTEGWSYTLNFNDTANVAQVTVNVIEGSRLSSDNGTFALAYKADVDAGPTSITEFTTAPPGEYQDPGDGFVGICLYDEFPGVLQLNLPSSAFGVTGASSLLVYASNSGWTKTYQSSPVEVQLDAPVGALPADYDAAKTAAPAGTALNTGTWTAARAAYLDNLNVGGAVASSAEAVAIQNNTRAVRVVPPQMVRPSTSSTVYRIELLLYDAVGNMEAPDSAPTIGVVNNAGTSRDANLDATTMSVVSTGRYRSTYTVASDHAAEELLFTFTVTEGTTTRSYVNAALIVDTVSIDFTETDRSNLKAIYDKLPSADYLRGTNLSTGAIATADAETIAGEIDLSALATTEELADVAENVTSILEDTGTTLPATLGELAATLEGIKGTGWTDQDLVNLDALVTSIYSRVNSAQITVTNNVNLAGDEIDLVRGDATTIVFTDSDDSWPSAATISHAYFSMRNKDDELELSAIECTMGTSGGHQIVTLSITEEDWDGGGTEGYKDHPYDIEFRLTSGGPTTRILGVATVRKDVTRDSVGT